MWHWLRNEEQHKGRARSISGALSIALHTVMLMVCGAVYKTDHDTLFLSIKKIAQVEQPVHFVELPSATAVRSTSSGAKNLPESCTQLAHTAPTASVIQQMPKNEPKQEHPAKAAVCEVPKPKAPLTYSKEDVAAKQHRELHQKIMDNWRAPRGIESDCSCELEAIVAANGAIQSIVTKKSSGILMFDIAARSALLAIEFPRWSRGKSIVIAFNN